MTPEQIRRLYNNNYADSYEDRFLHSEIAKPDSDFEVETIRGFLANGGPWLDVACGTGYFLSRFPEIERTGLDLSPAMIAKAKARNPGIEIREQNYLDEMPEWKDRWALVTCMWYAYGFTQTMQQLEQLIANLASWTAPQGACFLPLCDPALLSGLPLRYHMKGSPWAGDVYVTGITWSYIEEDGSHHEHVFAPHKDYMTAQFETYFETVELVTYPSSRPGLVARNKR